MGILFFIIMLATPCVQGWTSEDHFFDEDQLSELTASGYRPAATINYNRVEIKFATHCAYQAYKAMDEDPNSLKAREFAEFAHECERDGSTITLLEGETGHRPTTNYWVVRSRMGFIYESYKHVVVAFRGTVTKTDIATDLHIWNCWLQKDRFNGNERGFVHAGFHKAYMSMAKVLLETLISALRRGKTITLTGHSMGGAIANLAALHIAQEARAHGFQEAQIKLVTFNAPRVGDVDFAEQLHHYVGIRNIARFTNGEREIASTIILGSLGFKHAGTNIVVPNTSSGLFAGHRMACFLNGAAEAAFGQHNMVPKKANGVLTQMRLYRQALYLYCLSNQNPLVPYLNGIRLFLITGRR